MENCNEVRTRSSQTGRDGAEYELRVLWQRTLYSLGSRNAVASLTMNSVDMAVHFELSRALRIVTRGEFIL